MMLTPQSFKLCPISGETVLEELVNSLTHGLGLLLSIVGLGFFIACSYSYGSHWEMISSCIFGVTLVLLYGASTWYHSCRKVEVKSILQTVDHICIYLLIAGSYTPFALGPLRGLLGWSILAAIWGLAIIGIILKLTLKSMPEWFSLGFYFLMGWLVVVFIYPLSLTMSTVGFTWLFVGGFSYSIGTIFYMWNSLFLSHSIWHVFVLGGSVCHYFCVLFHIIIK